MRTLAIIVTFGSFLFVNVAFFGVIYRAMQRERAKGALLEKLLSHFPHPVLVFNDAGNISFSNEPYRIAERAGLSLLSDKTSATLLKKAFSRVAINETICMQLNGTQTWFRFNAAPIDDNHLAVVLENVSHQHKTEQTLVQKHAAAARIAEESTAKLITLLRASKHKDDQSQKQWTALVNILEDMRAREEELKKMNDFMIDRELKMIELKKQIQA